MTEKKQKTIEHRDLVGRIIKLNDFVAVTIYNQLKIAKVIKLTPKMVRIQNFNSQLSSRWYTGEHNRYPLDMIVITDNEYLTMYLLTVN